MNDQRVRSFRNNSIVQPFYAGFTLVEMLVVIGIITVLAALVAPALSGGKDRVKRVACISNLRQMLIGSLLFADEDPQGRYAPSMGPGDRNLNWLTNYLSPRSMVCPATRNYIREQEISRQPFTDEIGLLDLFKPADSVGSVPGISYYVSGFMGTAPNRTDIAVGDIMLRIPHVLKTINTVNTYTHEHGDFGLQGIAPGPSRIFIFEDFTWSLNLEYPDVGDNHGAAGANMGFCDGHAEFVQQSSYVKTWEASQDNGRSTITYPPP